MEEVLRLDEITKRYGAFTAVDRFSLGVPRGEVLGFLGPNGAGKTSTIRMIMGITRPDQGRLMVLGAPRAEDVKDRIGYLPEERGLYRKMTVGQTLHFLGQLKGLSGRKLSQRIDEQLERVGLTDWKKKRIEALSKGMSQKIQFVACLLHQPELLILDEPFSGLDPLNADLLERLLRELRQERVTVIFSTHQMETAERLCDRLVLINRGRKLVEGTLAELKHSFAARILLIEGEGDFTGLRSATGVAALHLTAGRARVELTEAADPQALLAALLPLVRVRRFEVQSPSLQEIFVALVERDHGRGPRAEPPDFGSAGSTAELDYESSPARRYGGGSA